jgi:VWFA-related protein
LNEDGHAQDIHYFAHESDLPLTLGLLVDTSLSQRRVLEEERAASFSFLQNMLRVDHDQAFVIHFDREVELLQDLTASDKKLESALDSLETPDYSRSGSPGQGGGSGGGHRGGSRGGGGGGFSGPGTLLYDAVYLASDELMRKQQGRKAVIMLTDGVDTGSKETLDVAIESAQRADTVVYCILFKDDGMNGGGGGFSWPGSGGIGGMGRGGPRGGGYPQREYPDGKKILERFAKETGGRMFEVSKKLTIGQIYEQIGDELRHQYNLGYTPKRDSAPAAGYHKIQLSTKKKGLIVQTREGYYVE